MVLIVVFEVVKQGKLKIQFEFCSWFFCKIYRRVEFYFIKFIFFVRIGSFFGICEWVLKNGYFFIDIICFVFEIILGYGLWLLNDIVGLGKYLCFFLVCFFLLVYRNLFSGKLQFLEKMFFFLGAGISWEKRINWDCGVRRVVKVIVGIYED